MTTEKGVSLSMKWEAPGAGRGLPAPTHRLVGRKRLTGRLIWINRRVALGIGSALGALLLGGALVQTVAGHADAASLHRPVDRGSHGLVRGAGRPSVTGRLVADYAFNGAAGPITGKSGWGAVDGGNGWGNNELEYYTRRQDNVGLDGRGHLQITARRETYSGADGTTRDFTSARIQTKGLFATTYGRIEARIKLPAGRGLWPAFWLLGSNIDSAGWPGSGEIDVMENIGQDPFTIFGSIHGPRSDATGAYAVTATEHSSTSLAAGFHVYGIEWSPNRIEFTLDGRVYATQTPASLAAGQRWVFNGKPFYLLLNVAVGGKWATTPPASTPMPASMWVDWVRVYSAS